jgi:hypothetical protein
VGQRPAGGKRLIAFLAVIAVLFALAGRWLFAARLVLVASQVFERLSGLGAIGGDLAAVCWALEELLECASPLLVGALLVPGGPKFFSSPSHCYR